MGAKKWLSAGIIILLFLGIGVMVFGFLLPYYSAETDMSHFGQLVLEAQTDGGWKLSWPDSDSADFYRVELYRGDPQPDPDENLVYRDFIKVSSSLMLPPIQPDEVLTVRVSAGADYRTLLGDSARYGEHFLQARVQFDAPAVSSFMLSIDEEAKTVSMEAGTSEHVRWQYTLVDARGEILEQNSPSGASHVLTFGEDGLPIPALGEACTLQAQAFREEPGIIIYGLPGLEQPITGESLRLRELDPVLTETSKNTIQITWEKTVGHHYEVQLSDGDGWTTAAEVAPDAPRQYTAWVEPGVTRTYRVVSVDDQGRYPLVSDPLEFTGRELAKYATVWPIRNLAALESPHSGSIVDYAIAGTAYYVLDQVDGMFAVRIGDRICYIDSNYCLINLPEYLGGLCNYNITNSFSSIYAIHDFPIPQVTGAVTAGYENIYQADGTCLAPLLYPTARKLYNAARSALDQGYRLKIYDAFRPYVATREVYDLTAGVLDQPLPDETYLGVPKSSLTLPEPRDDQEELTLGWLMTGRYYELRSFLARDGSSHNLGIAMDLTLEDLETGQELAMQSAIHDLSHFSVRSENNETAELLSSIMVGAGFDTLVSEWWHYQDNGTRDNLSPNPLAEGVSAQCWVKDDGGWKYRSPKGTFYAGETMDIAGTSYTFNESGYAAQ